MARYVVNGARAWCQHGTQPGTLKVGTACACFIQGEPVARRRDTEFCATFGTCGIKVSAGMSDTQCTPLPAGIWVGGKSALFLAGSTDADWPILEQDYLPCILGGNIVLIDPNQTGADERGFWSNLWDGGGLLLDLAMIAGDVLTIPSGEAVVGVAGRRAVAQALRSGGKRAALRELRNQQAKALAGKFISRKSSGIIKTGRLKGYRRDTLTFRGSDDTAKQLFRERTGGAKITGSLTKTKLSDGTEVVFRSTSKSGGATVEIIDNSKKILEKIHFQP